MNDYVQHTINFNVSSNLNFDTYLNSNGYKLSANTNIDRWMQHTNNVEAAKKYVEALEVSANEYYDLKNRCLEKLDSFLSEDYKNSNLVLTSYTVLESKVSPNGLSLFGTVNGRKHYQAFVSCAAFKIERRELPKNKLEAWANEALNLVLNWASTPVSITFSILPFVESLDLPYKVLDDDKATAYFNVK